MNWNLINPICSKDQFYVGLDRLSDYSVKFKEKRQIGMDLNSETDYTGARQVW